MGLKNPNLKVTVYTVEARSTIVPKGQQHIRQLRAGTAAQKRATIVDGTYGGRVNRYTPTNLCETITRAFAQKLGACFIAIAVLETRDESTPVFAAQASADGSFTKWVELQGWCGRAIPVRGTARIVEGR